MSWVLQNRRIAMKLNFASWAINTRFTVNLKSWLYFKGVIDDTQHSRHNTAVVKTSHCCSRDPATRSVQRAHLSAAPRKAPSERAACFSWRRSDVSISFNQSWGMPVLLPPGLTGWAELQLNNCNTFSSSGSEILDQRLQSAEHERINLTVRLHVRSSVCVFIPQQLINAQDSGRVRLAAAVKSHFFSFTHNKTTYLKSNRCHVSIITSRDL